MDPHHHHHAKKKQKQQKPDGRGGGGARASTSSAPTPAHPRAGPPMGGSGGAPGTSVQVVPSGKALSVVARWMNSTPAELLADGGNTKQEYDDSDPFFGAQGRLAPRAGLGAAPPPPPPKPPRLAVAGTTLERNLGAQLGFGGKKHQRRREEATPSETSSDSSDDSEDEGPAARGGGKASAVPATTTATATNARAALLQVDPSFLSKWQRKRQRQKEKKKKESEG